MFDEDLSLFFSANEHAVDAVWQSRTVQVIFIKPYTEQIGMASSNPMARAPQAVFAGVAKGQNILIDSVNYKIQSFEPDGTGLIVLQLAKA